MGVILIVAAVAVVLVAFRSFIPFMSYLSFLNGVFDFSLFGVPIWNPLSYFSTTIAGGLGSIPFFGSSLLALVNGFVALFYAAVLLIVGVILVK
jgi:hypothetical protein